MNELSSGYDAALGQRFTHVAPDLVIATLEVGPHHTQPYGLVHGGVYATLGESVCSVGAAIGALTHGKNAVGTENTTRFLRATRPGTTLTAEARPLSGELGPTRRIWEALITDDQGNQVAVSRVTIAILEPGKEVAGDKLKLE